MKCLLLNTREAGAGVILNFLVGISTKKIFGSKKKRNEQTDEQTDKQTDEQTDEQMAQLPEPKEGLFFDGFEI